MAKAEYVRKNGKVELVKTETIVLNEEQMLDRQQRLLEELRHCRQNIKQMLAREQDLLDELWALQTIIPDLTTAVASTGQSSST